MSALTQTLPVDPPALPDPLPLLRTLAGLPGVLLLREEDRCLLAAEPEEVVRVGPGESVEPALARILADQSPDELWALALSYEAGRSLLPIGPTGGETAPRLLALRYRAWAELGPEGLLLRGKAPERELLEARLSELSCLPPVGGGLGEPLRDLDREAYAVRFRSVQEDLAAGRYYQLNLTSAHRCGWEGSPLAFFERLVGDPLPLRAGYLDTGDLVIASASPELLLDYDPESRLAVSGPIKGTTVNADGAAERQRLLEKLSRDPKERAEHIMIVDLVRNDLGQVCRPGSVRPRRLFEALESGPVQHLVTHVEGELAPDRSSLDLLKALFPGGSVTGAPKIAAMRAIDALEVAPRGFYCGALGRVGPGGALSLTLPIRTATLEREAGASGRWQVSYPSGGGVVAGAPMEKELAELELKAERLRRALS